MVINHPTVFKFSIFDFGPLMYGSTIWGIYLVYIGLIWVFMGKYGYTWVYFGIYGCIWVYMDTYGYIWVCIGIYGINMGIYVKV